MIATQKKDITYILIILLGSAYPIATAILENFNFLIVVSGFFLWAIVGKKEFKHRLVLAPILISVYYLVYSFFDLVILPTFYDSGEVVYIIPVAIVTVIICVISLPFLFIKKSVNPVLSSLTILFFLISPVMGFINPFSVFSFFRYIFVLMFLLIPFIVIYRLFFLIVRYSKHERKLTMKYGNLSTVICSLHLLRAQIVKKFGYKKVSCSNVNCKDRNLLISAKNLVGLIGSNNEFPYSKDGNYYLNVFDNEGEITDAEYDIFEIHDVGNVDDLDSLITKMVSFFYNAIERRKPIDEIAVKIVGNPDISTNTERLLEERFGEVVQIQKE